MFSAYIAPAERSAIDIFSKELSLVKNKTLEQLLHNNTPQLQSLLSSRINRYPKPIRENLAVILASFRYPILKFDIIKSASTSTF